MKDKQNLRRWAGELSRLWWVASATGIFLLFIYVPLWLWGDYAVREGYTLAALLKDGAEISLKIGALIGGILAAYKYLYRRYEPMVYYVACTLVPFSLARSLCENNVVFRRVCGLKDCSFDSHDPILQHFHDLPLVVLHRSDMDTLGLAEGAKVDLEFTTPDNNTIWAIAYAFSYESAHAEGYKHEPVGLSLSLRRFFRIERPFQKAPGAESKDDEIKLPEKWQLVEHNSNDLAIMHQTFKKSNALVWIASGDYSVRFRDRGDACAFFPRDDFQGGGRIMEYVGISLRVLPRSWFRYKANS